MERPSLKTLPTKESQRTTRLVAVGAKASADAFATLFGNLFRSKKQREARREALVTRQAQALATSLGELKGAVMKGGQLLSVMGGAMGFPAAAVEALSQLQEETPPMQWSEVIGVLQRELGTRKLAQLQIDPEPVAAASLGQVHRAWIQKTGESLALKIQYPGVGESVQSDLANLKRGLLLMRLLPKGFTPDPYLEEIAAMVHRELDYERERETLLFFRHVLDGDPRFLLPRVFPAYCTRRVLAMSFEEGVRPTDPQALNLDPTQRAALGEAGLDLVLRELFTFNLMQTDPNFGNFKIAFSGSAPQILLLDFGASLSFSRAFIDTYRCLAKASYKGDRRAIMSAVMDFGFMPYTTPEQVREAFTDICLLVMEPMEVARRKGSYNFATSDLPQRLIEAMGRGTLTTSFRLPPREFLFLHRKLAGLFVFLQALQVEFDPRHVFESIVMR